MNPREIVSSISVLIGMLAIALPAAAVTAPDDYVYQVLFDTDVDPATGCDVAVNDAIVGNQTVHGIEQIAAVAVTRDVTGGSILPASPAVSASAEQSSTHRCPCPAAAGQ